MVFVVVTVTISVWYNKYIGQYENSLWRTKTIKVTKRYWIHTDVCKTCMRGLTYTVSKKFRDLGLFSVSVYVEKSLGSYTRMRKTLLINNRRKMKITSYLRERRIPSMRGNYSFPILRHENFQFMSRDPNGCSKSLWIISGSVFGSTRSTKITLEKDVTVRELFIITEMELLYK